MLDLLMWISWSAFSVYVFWLVTRAQRPQPMTLDELVVLWKIHKQRAGCRTPISKVKPVTSTHSDDFLGFRCECGYEYLSKRPIIQGRPFEQDMLVPLSSRKTKGPALLEA